MQISGLLPSVFAEKIAQQKAAAAVYIPKPCDEDEEDNDCIFENFRAAVQEYKEKLLLGLFALTDEEIQERLALFKAKFAPDPNDPNTTGEMIAMFEEMYYQLKEMLGLLQEKTESQRLITSSAENNDEDNDTRKILPYLPSNPLLQMALQSEGVSND